MGDSAHASNFTRNASIFNNYKTESTQIRIRYTAWFVGKIVSGFNRAMATEETVLCRICSNFVDCKHSISLFSRECLASGLAERLSKVTDVPVTPNDGLSQHICRPCNRKFISAESFRILAKASYEKNRTSLPRPLTGVTGSPKSTRSSRKRSKDTSGVGVSPHTHIRSDQQLSGRLLGRLEGRSVSVSVSRMRVINDFDRE